MAERKQAIAVARLPYEFSTAELKHVMALTKPHATALTKPHATAELKHVMALTKPHATTGYVDGKVHYLNLYTT